MALIANVNRGKKGKAFTAEDFYPYKEKKEIPKDFGELTQKIVRIHG
tara:strand:- start:219 stop:359 length:141 start_codon:yes stop_codon:yes gene_type:complete